MAKDDFKVKKGLVVGKGIVADSDVRANAFIGDGSQLTSLDYSNISGNLPNILDSNHVAALIDSADTHDSAAVAGQIAATLNDTVTITKNSTTDPALILQTTADGSSAAPIMEFIRNTSQANNGDYLGQIKFRGEDSGGSATTDVYAKITGKIQDATDDTEDGLIEFAVKSGGSNLILARMTGNNDGKLLIENGTDIEVESPGNITVAGNTVLTTADTLHDSDLVHGQIDSALVNAGTLTGTIDSSHIPSLNTSDISSGIFDSARIPSLATADITSGIFDSDLIPPLSAADITSGVFDSARIPALAAGGISNVVEDTTPQLGGNLDLDSNDITGTGNITIDGGATFSPSTGSATLTLKGSGTTDGDETVITENDGVLTVQADAISTWRSDTFQILSSGGGVGLYASPSNNIFRWKNNDIWYDSYANSNIDSHLNQSTATTGQVLSWNGTDYDWDSQIANVVEDTTPQLGGNLDLNSKDITGTGNITIDGIITSDGLTVDSEATIDGVNIGTGPGTGSNNTRVGDGALSNLTTGSNNTALGYRSGESTTTQGLNIYIGSYAGLNADGSNNTAVGYSALLSQGSASNNNGNTAIGSQSLYQTSTGADNTAVGNQAGNTLTTGSDNIMIGYQAYSSSATVNDEITLGDGTDKSFRIPGSSFYINGGSEGTTGTKVGVNTVSPTAQLHVNGDIYTDSDLSANNITRRNTTVTAGTYGSTTGIPVVTVDGSGFVDSIGLTTTLAGLTQIDVDNVRILDNTVGTTSGDLILDPTPLNDSTGTVVILGDLQVNGTTTTINSNNLSVKDKNIILADSATSSSQADGAGITVGAYTDNPKITYRTTGDKWEFNKDVAFADSDDLIMPDKSQIKLGNAADFLIYYDGTNSRIRNVGTDSGSIVIENYVNDASVFITTDDGAGNTTSYIQADGKTGEVKLNHYGSQKLATKSTGIDVTGEVLADSATISGNLTVGGNDVLTTNSDIDATNLTGTIDSARIPSLSSADITSGIFDSARIPSLAASDITSGVFDSDLIPQLRTDDVNEGTNVYYTDTRARGSVSGNKGLTYNSSTGVFDLDSANVRGFTIDSARTIGLIDSDYIRPLARAAIVAGTNITYDSDTGVISSSVGGHDSDLVQGQIDSNFRVGFTVGGNITFSDSDDLIMPDKSQILLGDDGDLQLYHDGGTDGNSRVRALNGENLFLESLQLNAKVIIKTSGTGGVGDNLKTYIIADGANGQVQLYHYGVQKFNTTSTGVDVTGEVLADSATISGNITSNGNDVLTTASLSGNKGITYNSSTGVFDIDSANIQSFTIDSARTIDLIDSAYIRPLARAAIVAGSNITYDSDTGIISSSGGGGAHDSDLVQGQIDSNFANDVTFGADITVGGIGIPNYVSLAQGAVGAGVTYYIDSGNTASLTTDSDKTITFTATGGDFTGLGGTAFTMLIKNNTSPDSDRVMTFVTSSGNTLHFNSANTLTVTGSKIGIVSGMVFGNNDIVLSSVGLDSSVTY
jgi:hypothetical protein